MRRPVLAGLARTRRLRAEWALGPDAVTVGAAILPLADFFARGGRRPEPEPPARRPAWQEALAERRA